MSTETNTDHAQRWVPASLPGRIQHYINGEHVDSIDGDTFDVLDPVTNQTYLQAASSKVADIDIDIDIDAAVAADRAHDYVAAGADFVNVGADVALLARATEALADIWCGADAPTEQTE